MAKKVLLPAKDLSRNYHILKLLTHSIYSIPTDGISPTEIVQKTKQWLGISPFQKKTLTESLELLAKKGFILKNKIGRKVTYAIEDKGREAYGNYVDIMTIWKLEQLYREKFKLHTTSEVFEKSKKYKSTHIAETAFYDWPLSFKPSTHEFKGAKEIRTFEVFEKKVNSS